MNSQWNNHAKHLSKLLKNNKEMQAHLFLEQLLLFPVDIQDKIIEEVSHLDHCSNEDIALIIMNHSIIDLK